MTRPIRIGLLAEGETELGSSVPYITPQEGGQAIDPAVEGSLHTLIRRELRDAGFDDCHFIHRHPTIKEQQKGQVRVGYSIDDPKYLRQTIVTWQAHEVDMIVLVIDSDEHVERRQQSLEKALLTIRSCQFSVDDEPISDQSCGGLAIKNFETWLLADPEAIRSLLDVELKPIPLDLETLPADPASEDFAKAILDRAINESAFAAENFSNQRELLVRWELAKLVNLAKVKERCPQGYGPFSNTLIATTERVHERI